jgi:Secretion system C-terminal sorting domain
VPGATRYEFYLNNNLTQISTNPNLITFNEPLECNQKYTLKVIAKTPCGDMATPVYSVAKTLCTGPYARFALAPHPTIPNTIKINVNQIATDQQANLFFDATSLANEQVQNVNIIDKEGNIVQQTTNIGTQQTTLNLANLAEGIYTIEVSGNNDYKEQQSYEFTITKTPQQLEEELASTTSTTITDEEAKKLLEVQQQELYQKLRDNSDLLTNSTILQNFMLIREQKDFGIIEKINATLSEYDVATAQNLIDNWQPQTQLELNCLHYYNYFIKYLNGTTFTNNDISDMYSLANLCPQKHGEIIFAARSLYNYITQFDETFNNACGNNTARTIQKIDMAKPKPSASTTSIYPNPSQGNFNIKFPTTSRGINTVKVLDAFGKLMLQHNVISGTKNININNNLSNGIYLLQITNSTTGKTETQKLIINK